MNFNSSLMHIISLRSNRPIDLVRHLQRCCSTEQFFQRRRYIESTLDLLMNSQQQVALASILEEIVSGCDLTTLGSLRTSLNNLMACSRASSYPASPAEDVAEVKDA